MDVVIAGYGRAGELHAALLSKRPDIRVTGVADATAARRDAATTRFPGATVTARLDELDVHADVVVICTPPACHEPDTRTALTQHRAHVLCEKPAVLDANTGHRLGKIAATTSRVLHPVHNYLHSPAINQLRQIATQSIGPITHAAITISRPGPAHGHPDWQPTWRTAPAAGGGILYDHGPHACYLVRHLTGQPAISAQCRTQAGDNGTDHAAHLDLRFADGATATITLSWNATSRINSYELHGTHGSVRLRNGRLELTRPTPTLSLRTENHATGGHTHKTWTNAVHQTFLNHISRPSHDNQPWNTAVHVAEITTAARASAAAEGRPIAC